MTFLNAVKRIFKTHNHLLIQLCVSKLKKTFEFNENSKFSNFSATIHVDFKKTNNI
jgi:hypothetical protein